MEYLTVINIFLLLAIVEISVLSAQKIHKYTPYDCSCGEIANKTVDKIIGGKNTKPHAYPFQAALKVKGILICGGTVINDYYILTAGHCIPKKYPLEVLTIHLGLHHKSIPNNKRYQSNGIKDIIIHEKYYSFKKYDIALLKLHRRITFTDFVKPICLPYKYEKIEGKKATVIGWGRTVVTGRNIMSGFLQEIQLDVLTRKECQKYMVTMPHTKICTVGSGQGIMQGDSGGPLFYVNNNGMAVQIGISSFIIERDVIHPSFYASVQALKANCNTLDVLVQDALVEVTNKSSEIDKSTNENIKIQKNLQTTLRPLESNLSNALVNTYLASYIYSLESLYQMSLGTNEESCFHLRPIVVEYFKNQTEIYYKVCVSRFSKSTTEDELKLSNLAKAVNTTSKTLRDCGNNPAYRRNIQFGRICVRDAKASFTKLITNLNSSIGNQVNYVEEVSKCITNTINRGEDLIETLNDGVSDCVQRVSNNTELIQTLSDLLPGITKTQNVFKNQTVVAYSEELQNLIISVPSVTKEVKILLSNANKAKIAATKSSTSDLASVFNPTKEKLAQEANKFESNNGAKSCVATFQNSLTANLNNRVKQFVTCIIASAEPRFDEINSIETDFLNFKAIDKNTVLNCLVNIDNIFPIGGITTCIEDARKNYENDLRELDLRLTELKTETELIERRVTSCTRTATETGTRQVGRDSSAFVNCIKRSTNNSTYTF